MADITPTSPTIDGATLTLAATAVAGDAVKWTGGDLMLIFDNGHTSPITVNIVPTRDTAVVPGAGPIDVPTRSLAIANGAKGVMFLPRDQVSHYLNSARKIPLTYTSGDTALLVAALNV